MLVQYDYLVEELLQELQIPFKREDRKVKQAFRHIGHSHVIRMFLLYFSYVIRTFQQVRLVIHMV